MQQSNIIIGYITIAYLIFITLRGELPTYITILRGGDANAAGTPAGASPVAAAVNAGAGALQPLAPLAPLAPQASFSGISSPVNLVSPSGVVNPDQSSSQGNNQAILDIFEGN